MAWLAGWSYKKKITIDGSADGAQTDYQMRLLVHSGSDGDSGNDVYLGGHCTDFPNDIQFTKADGETPLDYWVEDAAADPCPIWVEFDNIADGGGSPSYTEFYIYYGKSGQGTSTDGDNTFKFFKDFEDGVVGVQPSGWTKTGSGGDTFLVANDQAKRGTKSVKVHDDGVTPNVVGVNDTAFDLSGCVIRYYFRFPTAGKRPYCGHARNQASATTIAVLCRDSNNDWRYNISGGWANIPNWTAPTNNIWYEIELYHRSSDHKVKAVKNRTQDSGWRTPANSWTTVDFIAYIGYYPVPVDYWIDVIYVRKYTANEPTWGTWGSEETPGYMSPLPAFRRPS